MTVIGSQRFAVLVFIAASLILFFASLNREVEGATSPSNYGARAQTLLRKTYSVVAFAILGYLFTWSHRRTGTLWLLASGVAIGSFSAIIEFFQHRMGAPEGLVWNAADTLMGLFGGLFGALFYARPKKWV